MALSDLGVQHASYELAIDRFFVPGAGVPYVYNGKPYSFNQGVVAEYDMIMQLFASQKVEVTMNIVNYFNPATATSKWIWSRPQLITIGKHIFCL